MEGKAKVPTNAEELHAHALAYFKSHKSAEFDEVIESFVKSVKYVKQQIAHMHYGPLLEATSEAEFKEFLPTIGIPLIHFQAIRDASCAGDIDARSCIRNPGYACDPSLCQSH